MSNLKFVATVSLSSFFIAALIGVITLPENAGMAAIVLPWFSGFLGLVLGLISSLILKNTFTEKHKVSIFRVLGVMGIFSLLSLIYLFFLSGN